MRLRPSGSAAVSSSQELQHPRGGQRSLAPEDRTQSPEPFQPSLRSRVQLRAPQGSHHSSSPHPPSALVLLLVLFFIHNKSYSSGTPAPGCFRRQERRMGFLWTGTWILVLVVHSSPIQAFPKPGGIQGTWTLSFPPPLYSLWKGEAWQYKWAVNHLASFSDQIVSVHIDREIISNLETHLFPHFLCNGAIAWIVLKDCFEIERGWLFCLIKRLFFSSCPTMFLRNSIHNRYCIW